MSEPRRRSVPRPTRPPRPARAPEGRAAPDDAPHVLLDVEYQRGLLYLVLANDGPAAAWNVRVRFERSLRGVGGEKDIATMRVWSGLPLLRAGKELRVFLDAAPLLFRRRQPTRFAATVRYTDRDGREFSRVFRHDLALWRDFGEVLRAGEALGVRP